MYLHILNSHIIVYNEAVYLPMELYYLCIDFVFQFIVEKYRNKLKNQIKSINQIRQDTMKNRTRPIIVQWPNTVKPRYNEVLGTIKNYLVISGFSLYQGKKN